MSIIIRRLLKLAPRKDNLANTVVLAQAWKKSHEYIRHHNWYADTLELDVSAFDLESKLGEWSAALKENSFEPEKLRLIPAPKNARWVFDPIKDANGDFEAILNSPINATMFNEWHVKDDKADGGSTAQSQKLRPLAHLTIRDQTLATAVMMCLAEAIETMQGDTSEPDFAKARENGVVSYGNRLQCQWKVVEPLGGRAKFSWGNSRTYRQYFEDYRTFLARPKQVCAQHALPSSGKRALYVISLDLKSFYDQIDTKALQSELKRLEREYREQFALLPDDIRATKQFWECVKQIFNWQWCDKDNEFASQISGDPEASSLPLGLPQGMVASGFFANAYLIGFDMQLNDDSLAGFLMPNNTWPGDIRLVDYCRYVDDIRVTVEAQSGNGGPGLNHLLCSVKTYVSGKLTSHLKKIGAEKELEFSHDKCSVTPYRSMAAQGNLSAMMALLQEELSGTFDFDSLVQAAGGLEGLLVIADRLESVEEENRSFRLRLATIDTPNFDVRDDTVKRFVATRLAKSLRERLAMTDLAATIGKHDSLQTSVTKGALLSHEFEATARKFIKCWAENPAMVVLLRCGLDLYPHPKLLTPVLEALACKLFEPKEKLISDNVREVRTAEYVAAELFRAGTVETGCRPQEEYTESIDITAYREELAVFARQVLTDKNCQPPWYLQQQARLFLASVRDFSVPFKDPILGEIQNLANFRNAMLYEPVSGADLQKILPFAFVAQQISREPARCAIWLREGLQNTSDELQQKSIVRLVSLHLPDLLYKALSVGNGKKLAWLGHVAPSFLAAARQRSKQPIGLVDNKEYSLLQVMASKNNELGQENGLLALTRALLKVEDIKARLEMGLNAAEINLECVRWSRLHALDANSALEAKLDSDTGEINPLYERPSWVEKKKMWLYGLGRILRAALTGEFDFTSRRYLITEDVNRYTGLRSTWFKRRFGLVNNSRGLLDEPAPVSPWLSGFLSTLLQWPGVDFHANGADGVADVQTPAELLNLIEVRIATQRALYGPRSETPMYVVPSNQGSELINRPLRIAIVQPLLPKLRDFDVKDPTHWTKGTLAAHRSHLAEICKLAHQQLRTWASARTDQQGPEDPIVDIVLFPEVAVHPEHVFLLRRLADELRANIFVGLTFQISEKLGAVINQGLWLIRTEEAGYGRSIQYAWQGKAHPMEMERAMGVVGYRPHITLLELPIGVKSPTRIAAAICYDATDLDLIADLRDRSDVFLVAAFNKDVQTFDNMVAALHFHMYQPVVLANAGEFGGSTAQAPMPNHNRLLSHVHGNNQLAINVFEIDPTPFKSTTKIAVSKEIKTPPAGYHGRPKSRI